MWIATKKTKRQSRFAVLRACMGMATFYHPPLSSVDERNEAEWLFGGRCVCIDAHIVAPKDTSSSPEKDSQSVASIAKGRRTPDLPDDDVADDATTRSRQLSITSESETSRLTHEKEGIHAQARFELVVHTKHPRRGTQTSHMWFDTEEDREGWLSAIQITRLCSHYVSACCAAKAQPLRPVINALLNDVPTDIVIQNTFVDSLSMRGIGAVGEAVTNMLNAPTLAPIRTLSLVRVGIGPNEAHHLASFISAVDGLERLDLSGNRIEDAGLSMILGALNQKCTKLEEIRLDRNRIDDGGITRLAHFLQFTVAPIRLLSVEQNIFGRAGSTTLITGIGENGLLLGTLKVLRLGYNEVGDGAAVLIAQILSGAAPANSTDKSFGGVPRGNISPIRRSPLAGGAVASPSPAKSDTLVMTPTRTGASPTHAGTPTTPNLVKTPTGGVAVLPTSTPGLEELNLTHCMIGDGGVDALAMALPHAKCLTMLCLRGNIANASATSKFLAQASLAQRKCKKLRVQVGGADGSGSGHEGEQPLRGKYLTTDRKIMNGHTVISRLVLRRVRPRQRSEVGRGRVTDALTPSSRLYAECVQTIPIFAPQYSKICD